jgi:hypothetical protein
MNNLDIGVMIKDQNIMKTFFTKNGAIEDVIGNNLPVLFRQDNQHQREVLKTTDFNGGGIIELADASVQTEDKKVSSDYCAICNVRHDSAEDKPPKGITSSFWFGCSAESCDYWVHSYCFGIGNYKADFKKAWEKVKWSCPKHQKK